MIYTKATSMNDFKYYIPPRTNKLIKLTLQYLDLQPWWFYFWWGICSASSDLGVEYSVHACTVTKTIGHKKHYTCNTWNSCTKAYMKTAVQEHENILQVCKLCDWRHYHHPYPPPPTHTQWSIHTYWQWHTQTHYSAPIQMKKIAMQCNTQLNQALLLHFLFWF